MRTIEEKYLNDPEFHSLVDMMYHLIGTKDYSPSELREAAMLASIKFQMVNARKYVFTYAEGEKVIHEIDRLREEIQLKMQPIAPAKTEESR
jgi:hypothetical protein